jgi:hypothetical protein
MVRFLGKILIRNHESELFTEFIYSLIASDIEIKEFDSDPKNKNPITRFFFKEAVDHFALNCLVPLFVFSHRGILLSKEDLLEFGHYIAKEGEDSLVKVNLATIQATAMLTRNLKAYVKTRNAYGPDQRLKVIDISFWIRSAPTHLVDATISLLLKHRALHMHQLKY